MQSRRCHSHHPESARSASGKTIVLGMIERDGDITTPVVSEMKKRTLHPLVAMSVESDRFSALTSWPPTKGLPRRALFITRPTTPTRNGYAETCL